MDARQDYPWICQGQMLPTVPLAAQGKDVGAPSLFSEFPYTPDSVCLENVCQPLCQRGIPTQSNLYVLEMSISCLKKKSALFPFISCFTMLTGHEYLHVAREIFL